MLTIANWSALHGLHPIPSGIKAFSELCDKYSEGCFSGFYSLFALTNKAWVSWKYSQYLKTVITPYKLGKLTTEQFLDRMLGIFSFLEEEHLTYPADLIDALWKNKEDFISFKGIKGKESLSKKHISSALLEKAWNAIIDFKESDKCKFDSLSSKVSEENPLYLISNTNELNAHKILNMFRKEFPHIKFENVNLSPQVQGGPIQIAPHIYLCLSYQMGAYKTDIDNKEAQNSTPCLLKALIESFEGKYDPSEIQIVSQYQKDLDQAKQLGISPDNIHSAKDFFPVTNKTLKQAV